MSDPAFCPTLAQAAEELKAYAASHRINLAGVLKLVAEGGAGHEFSRWFEHEGVIYKATLTYFDYPDAKMHLLSLYPKENDLEIENDTAQEMANAFLPENFLLPEELTFRLPGHPRPVKFGYKLPG